MIKKYLVKVLIVISLYGAYGIITTPPLQAQVFGPQTIKWIWVSSLRQYFSSTGAEIEYGRRGRSYLNTDQLDGLRWPAQYQYQDHNVGKAIWIGTTNFADPNGTTYPNKVLCIGRAALYVNSIVYPVDFKLIGRFTAPTVIVDGQSASDLDANDLDLANGDETDINLPADRMIYNNVNTPIGITIYRKVLASSQQYHDNYYIYEYVFKNTGLSDNTGGTLTPRQLTDVIFDFRYRFSDGNEAYFGGWGLPAVNYGKNCINDAVGQDATHTLPAPNDNIRATIAYYGPHASAPTTSDDIGGPNYADGRILSAIGFTGEMVLHADTSPHDTTNDITQPRTTAFYGADGPIESSQASYPFNPSIMTQQYKSMTAGHPNQTQAEQVGEDANGWPTTFVNTWGGNLGGYANQQGFGPYTLDPGDSIRIVIAEAVAGINREKNMEVAKNWFTWYSNGKSGTVPLQLPSGSPYGATTIDGNIYKNSWVFTGKDSLYQTFRRATANYNSNYNIPQPPPPPDRFTVTSFDDKIKVEWSNSADNCPNFDGYQLYRAETKTDTKFDLIFSCDISNVAHSFDDITAQRGFNYFYYIQTKDNGSTNLGSTDLKIPAGEPLVSSIFYTMTNVPASLRRPGVVDKLADIRVVPNPYNIRAKSIQFGTDRSVENQLVFFGLPKLCMIKIFTETGDLVQTIDHNNGSGDEKWNLMTSSNQLVVSGLYIAYFEVSEGPQKGNNIFRKFIIIR